MVSAIMGAATVFTLAVAIAADRWARTDDRDRLLMAIWLMLYWSAEEMAGRAYGWGFVTNVAPALDAAAAMVLLTATAFRPKAWKAATVLILWAMCVAHVVDRLNLNPSALDTWRYHALINTLYPCMLLAITAPGAWDVIRSFGDRRSGAGSVLSRARSLPGPRP